MTNTRQLIDYSNQKILNLCIENKTLISETGTTEKLKTTRKEFSSVNEAQENLFKKEWQFLKKGYVFSNPEAQFGEALLHLHVSKVYTGAQAFVATEDGIFIYKDEKDSKTQQELQGAFLQIDHKGRILNEISLPKALVWKMYYKAATQEILFNLDHEIFAYSLRHATFKQLSQNQDQPFSFLSVAANHIAFADAKNFYICDTQHNVLQQDQHTLNIVNGNMVCCGQLSADGRLLALHDEVSKIKIIAAQSGKCLETLTLDFEMLNDMQFIQNNQSILFWEKYGTWSLRKINLTTKKEAFFEASLAPYINQINGFCLNQNQSRLAILQRHEIHIIDLIEEKLIGSFRVQHLVRSAHLQFIGELVAVRTDYGCFSLYQV